MNIQKTLNIILALSLVVLLIKMNQREEATISNDTSEPTDYTNIPKKNIGNHAALYATPTTVVGTKVDGKVNWIAIAHIGNIGFDCLILSSGKSHYSNQGIKKNGTLSVNMVSESMMIPADFVGMKSGKDVDKSNVFEYFEGSLENAPMIKSSPITMECEVIDVYDTEHHDNFIVKVVNTYVSESVLDENEKIDFNKVKPLLFEMPKRGYYKLGERVGDAWKEGNKFKNQ
ncbi:flavin reductase family protein [Marinifilum caeruleilacunae]|uniref:Flavin reductase family protein n=1 Tax=Marinifilum caeruleilacunae TaxID=2499076 RepID=A0ABX1WQD0_9BACT|nr:flavin reductase family protein [Marinifilum caeruleilacunae]NOU58287.1 flavin reductase family protein [Marinifilum caeruleilacunae]